MFDRIALLKSLIDAKIAACEARKASVCSSMEADVACNEVLQTVCYCVSLPQMSQAARLPDDAEIGYNTGHEVFLAMDIRCCCDHLIPCGKGRAMRARSFDWMKARRADRTKRIYEQHDT